MHSDEITTSNDALGEGERRGVARDGPRGALVPGATEQLDADVDARDARASAQGGQRKGSSATTDVEHPESGQRPSAEQILEHDLQPPLEVVGVHQRIELARDGVVEPLGVVVTAW